MRVPLGWTVKEVGAHLEKKLGFRASTLRLVVQKYGSDIALLQRSLTLSEEGFYRAAVVFAEHKAGESDEKVFRSSRLYKAINLHLNTVKWSVTLPPAPVENQSSSDTTDNGSTTADTSNEPLMTSTVIVEFDKRCNVAEFKQHLEQYMHGARSNQFRLYKILKNGQEFELTRQADPLTYHTESSMKVVLGRALEPDEYRVPLWFFEPDKDVFMTSLGDIIVGKGMNISAIQNEVVSLCKDIVAGPVTNEAQHKHATAIVEAPLSHLRLRRKNYRTPTAVLAGELTVGREITIFSGWEMSVEILAAPETYSNSSTAIFVRRWHPGNHTFGPIQEIIVKDLAVKSAKSAISELSNLPVDRIDIAKGIGSFPFHYSPLEMHGLAWNPDVSYLGRIPVSIMTDSALLYYRDRKEEAEELTQERRLEIERQEATRSNHVNRVPYRKERALKIKTAD